MTPLIAGLTKALAILDAYDVVPGTLEMSRLTFDALKKECLFVDASQQPNSFMGVKVVVRK